MHLIVGLGNPGPKYLLTRHNIGFLVIDALIGEFSGGKAQEQFNSITYRFSYSGQDVLLVKPQTFMNLSGEAVQAFMAFYKIPIDNLLVIHDEIDQVFGQLKLQKARGHGGHNGVRNIHEKLGNNEYARLRLGVGRPSNPQMQVVDYVLQNFPREDEVKLAEFIGTACDVTMEFIESGFMKTQNKFNS